MIVKAGVRTDVAIQDLLEAGVHFGHQTKRWNPKMKRFIFDERNKIYIIDLAKTLAQLKRAQQFLYDTVSRGRSVLLVGTKKQAQLPLQEAAEHLHQPFVITRWLGGTLTNNQTIRKSVSRLRHLEGLETSGAMAQMPKKEVARLRRELQKLRRNLQGISEMTDLPGALFVVDVTREAIAVAEANRLKIPVVAIVDTNCDPDPIDYPIPGNDDAIRAIRLMVKVVSDTIQQAANEYAKVAAEEARKRAVEEAAAKARAREQEEERKRQEEVAKKARAEALAKVKAAKTAKEKAPAAEKPAAAGETAAAAQAAPEAAPKPDAAPPQGEPRETRKPQAEPAA